MFEIREDDLAGEQTRALVAIHLAGMHAGSPPGSVFALDLRSLQTPDVTVSAAWKSGRVAAIGALKMLSKEAAEVKSMRTHPGYLRMGAGGATLEIIITAATARGVRRLSLETGSGAAFEPALSLYRRRGFYNGVPVGAYKKSEFNQFLHLDLIPVPRSSDSLGVSNGSR